MNKKFLVSAATGSTGREITTLLLAKGHSVRVLVHNIDARSEALAKAGAEVFQGDLLDFNAVTRALAGVDGAYFCYPIKPGLLQATAYFAQAAKEGGVKTIVNMSQISARRDSESHAAQDHWLGERIFDWSGIDATHVRPTFFAEWLLYIAPIIGQGTLPQPFNAESRHAPVAAEDQAKVIANILDAPEGHAGKIYPLYGAKDLTQYEITEEVSKALGIPIKYEQIEVPKLVLDMRNGGRRRAQSEQNETVSADTAFLIQHLEAVAIDHKNGLFAGTNEVVEKIGKTKPMTVQDFVSKHRAAFLTGSEKGRSE